MAHRNARLTEFGRLLGATHHRTRLAAGLGRREPGGCRGPPPPSGLVATTPRAEPAWPTAAPSPTTAPTPCRVDQVRRVLAARRHRCQGPHRLGYHLGMPRSTVYGVLRRHGMSRLAHTDRASGVVVRYQRERPGELVHLDVKKLGRIPDGGGHRIHGRAVATRVRGIGYDLVHSAVDDRSRVAFSQLLPDEKATTVAHFLVEAAEFADHGVRIERVLTDNAKAYTESVLFAETAARLGIRLKRTRRYRPQTNGKVERFTAPCLRSGPMPGCIAPTPSAAGPSPVGCASTITSDHTPRSTA
jgi:transposase InsO family protein